MVLTIVYGPARHSWPSPYEPGPPEYRPGRKRLRQELPALQLEQGLKQHAGTIKYLSPERGGLLQYEARIEQNVTHDPAWLGNTRRRNRQSNFANRAPLSFDVSNF